MAATKIEFEGEIRIQYRIGPDILLPVRFYAEDPDQAQELGLRQAIVSLIVDESPALLGAQSVSMVVLQPVL